MDVVRMQTRGGRGSKIPKIVSIVCHLSTTPYLILFAQQAVELEESAGDDEVGEEHDAVQPEDGAGGGAREELRLGLRVGGESDPHMTSAQMEGGMMFAYTACSNRLYRAGLQECR